MAFTNNARYSPSMNKSVVFGRGQVEIKITFINIFLLLHLDAFSNQYGCVISVNSRVLVKKFVFIYFVIITRLYCAQLLALKLSTSASHQSFNRFVVEKGEWSYRVIDTWSKIVTLCLTASTNI